MTQLHLLKDTSRPPKKVQRIGRGFGSRRGAFSGRGMKGAGSRSGWRARHGYEGGQFRLFAKLPTKGFTRGRHKLETHAISLAMIERLYTDGETVNHATLRQKGYAPREIPGGLKILANGNLTKKVIVEAHRFSKAALQYLQEKGIKYHQLKEEV